MATIQTVHGISIFKYGSVKVVPQYFMIFLTRCNQSKFTFQINIYHWGR